MVQQSRRRTELSFASFPGRATQSADWLVLQRLTMLLERLEGWNGSPTYLAHVIARTDGSSFSRFSCIDFVLLLKRLPMRTARHMCVQGMDIFESYVTVATTVLRSMELHLAVIFPSALAFEGEVAFRTETMPSSNVVVFKDIQALTELATIATFANGKVVLSHWRMSATASADM
ncbi:hypothetical protein ACJQWK_11230 [Exserohilum turcicum]